MNDSEIHHCARRIKNLLALYHGRELPPAAIVAIELNTEQLVSAIADRRRPVPIVDSPNVVPFRKKLL